jgi:hypothetical protein
LKYSYSHNEEDFSGFCDSVEEAILESLSEYGGEYDTVYIGEAYKKTIGDYLWQCDIENLLERMQEQAQDECGDCAEDWLSGPYFEYYVNGESNEDRDARHKALYAKKADRLAFLVDGFKIVLETWATDAGEQPGFWHVRNIQQYDCKTMKLVDAD